MAVLVTTTVVFVGLGTIAVAVTMPTVFVGLGTMAVAVTMPTVFVGLGTMAVAVTICGVLATILVGSGVAVYSGGIIKESSVTTCSKR